ncbi:exonuclease 3'-5' domain-containing protein 2 [Eurytemora carolleeae]|uniref:exonuclease 3'-5' domain-containing protein 2 n=1 Tax=Eurytemora carolleeae TaxID=1294199 RepID=UPI000C7677A1|nr:exonuclease 3'-5' domain-containing protein 2 [Eurytemora carolleeae]|eukprot:XP_023343406.1 exonuclease 3'-5' domain-containing protein 2-like [Eurytemora affinis]
MDTRRRFTQGLLLAGAGVSVGLIALGIYRRRSHITRMDREIFSHISVERGGRISLVSSASDWEKIWKDVSSDLEKFPFLGLDTEWVNSKGYVGPISLLQLGTFSGHAILVRLCTLDKIPISLRDILANPDIIKVGVAVLDDSSKLLVEHQLDVLGCLDLRHLAVLQQDKPGKLGLEALALNYLGVQLDKDWRIRSGNWEAPELSPRQLTYAANDALVAINIFWVLLRTQFCSDLSSRFHILSWNGPRLISECIQAVERFIDVRFSSKGWMSGALSSEKQKSTKFLSVLKLKGNSIRKSPLYHNCQLQAPDGQVVMYNICTCTTEIVDRASDCNFLETNDDYTPHSRAVVHYFLREGGLINLEVKWRKHFLSSMKPKHLPDLWSINHQEERLGVKAAENRIDMEQYILATQGFTVDQTLDLEEYRKLKKPQLGINPDNQLEATDPNEVLESNFGTPERDSGSSVSEESFSEFVIT